jgi:hypothetical protein
VIHEEQQQQSSHHGYDHTIMYDNK